MQRSSSQVRRYNAGPSYATLENVPKVSIFYNQKTGISMCIATLVTIARKYNSLDIHKAMNG